MTSIRSGTDHYSDPDGNISNLMDEWEAKYNAFQKKVTAWQASSFPSTSGEESAAAPPETPSSSGTHQQQQEGVVPNNDRSTPRSSSLPLEQSLSSSSSSSSLLNGSTETSNLTLPSPMMNQSVVINVDTDRDAVEVTTTTATTKTTTTTTSAIELEEAFGRLSLSSQPDLEVNCTVEQGIVDGQSKQDDDVVVAVPGGPRNVAVPDGPRTTSNVHNQPTTRKRDNATPRNDIIAPTDDNNIVTDPTLIRGNNGSSGNTVKYETKRLFSSVQQSEDSNSPRRDDDADSQTETGCAYFTNQRGDQGSIEMVRMASSDVVVTHRRNKIPRMTPNVICNHTSSSLREKHHHPPPPTELPVEENTRDTAQCEEGLKVITSSVQEAQPNDGDGSNPTDPHSTTIPNDRRLGVSESTIHHDVSCDGKQSNNTATTNISTNATDLSNDRFQTWRHSHGIIGRKELYRRDDKKSHQVQQRTAISTAATNSDLSKTDEVKIAVVKVTTQSIQQESSERRETENPPAVVDHTCDSNGTGSLVQSNDQTATHQQEQAVVLFGKLGHGKTRLVNLLCGESFESVMSTTSCTRTIQVGKSLSYGITIIDTPGFFSSTDIASHIAQQKTALEGKPLNGIYAVVKWGRADEIAETVNRIMDFSGDDDIRVIVTHTDVARDQQGFNAGETKARLSSLLDIPTGHIEFVGKDTPNDFLEDFIRSTLHKSRCFELSEEQKAHMSSHSTGARQFEKQFKVVLAKIDAAQLVCEKIRKSVSNGARTKSALVAVEKATRTIVDCAKLTILNQAVGLPPKELNIVHTKAKVDLSLRLEEFVSSIMYRPTTTFQHKRRNKRNKNKGVWSTPSSGLVVPNGTRRPSATGASGELEWSVQFVPSDLSVSEIDNIRWTVELKDQNGNTIPIDSIGGMKQIDEPRKKHCLLDQVWPPTRKSTKRNGVERVSSTDERKLPLADNRHSVVENSDNSGTGLLVPDRLEEKTDSSPYQDTTVDIRSSQQCQQDICDLELGSSRFPPFEVTSTTRLRNPSQRLPPIYSKQSGNPHHPCDRPFPSDERPRNSRNSTDQPLDATILERILRCIAKLFNAVIDSVVSIMGRFISDAADNSSESFDV